MLLSLSDLLKHLDKDRKAGRRIVFTNGCFDILHVGHARYLEHAKKCGDILVVGVNSDDSVRRLKGSSRPILTANDRAELVDCIRYVDYVVLFGEDTAEALVAAVKPDVYVKGGDYTLDNNPEARLVAGYGGEAIFVPLVPGRSTTEIATKIKRNT